MCYSTSVTSQAIALPLTQLHGIWDDERVDTRLATIVQVSLDWASRHDWEPGRALLGTSTNAPALWLVLDGTIELRMCTSSYQLTAGSAIIMPPFTPREITTRSGACWLSLGLRPTLMHGIDLFQLLSLPQLWQPTPQDFVVLRWCMQQLITNKTREGFTASLLKESARLSIIGICWQALGADHLLESTEPDLPHWFLQTLRRVNACPEISVSELAEHVGYSVAHYRRLFSQYMGISPHAFLQRNRLEMAQNLLSTTTVPIAEIAARLGFASPSQFSRLFKATLGYAPGDFRRQHQTVQL